MSKWPIVIGATPFQFSHGFAIFYFVNLIVGKRDLNTRYLCSKHHEVPVELRGPLLILEIEKKE